MRAVIVSAVVAFFVSILGTPIAIKAFTRLKAGQPIRSEGPKSHLAKKGTPTMGGVVLIVATVLAYVAGHFVFATLPSNQLGTPSGPTTTGVVLLGLFVGLGAGRLHRRLPEGAQAQQPGPQQAHEADRPDGRRACCSA